MPGVSGNISNDFKTFMRDSSDKGGKLSKEDAQYAKGFENELREQGQGKTADAVKLASSDGTISKQDRKDIDAAWGVDTLKGMLSLQSELASYSPKRRELDAQ